MARRGGRQRGKFSVAQTHESEQLSRHNGHDYSRYMPSYTTLLTEMTARFFVALDGPGILAESLAVRVARSHLRTDRSSCPPMHRSQNEDASTNLVKTEHFERSILRDLRRYVFCILDDQVLRRHSTSSASTDPLDQALPYPAYSWLAYVGLAFSL
jgi:hypothetical protein